MSTNIYNPNSGVSNRFPNLEGNGAGGSLTPAQIAAINNLPAVTLVSSVPNANGTDYDLTMSDGSVIPLENVINSGTTGAGGLATDNTLTDAQIQALAPADPNTVYIASDSGQVYIVSGSTLIPLVSAGGSTASPIQGQLAGASATFAALPTVINGSTEAITDGDFAILTADDGANVAGIYVNNGGVYTFLAPLGSGGGSQVIVSTDANNSVTSGADGGAFYDDTATQALIAANTAANVLNATNISAIDVYDYSLTEAAIIAATTGTDDTFYIASDTQQMYIWNGSAMQLVSPSATGATISTDTPNQLTTGTDGGLLVQPVVDSFYHDIDINVFKGSFEKMTSVEAEEDAENINLTTTSHKITRLEVWMKQNTVTNIPVTVDISAFVGTPGTPLTVTIPGDKTWLTQVITDPAFNQEAEIRFQTFASQPTVRIDGFIRVFKELI